MPDMVTLTLAHPLNSEQVTRLHAKDIKDYNSGDKITVPRDDARAIINAGFASQIDPADHSQVEAALSGSGSTTKASKSSS